MVSAKVELKDLKARIIGEVGEVIRNGKRSENERITIYQSMGKLRDCFIIIYNHMELILIF